MTSTITLRLAFRLPEEEQAAKAFEEAHIKYRWIKEETPYEIRFEHTQSQWIDTIPTEGKEQNGRV